MGKDSSNPDKKMGNDLSAEKILFGKMPAIIPLYQASASGC